MNSQEKNIIDNNGIFYYLCVICGNIRKFEKKVIFCHLCCDGICRNYTIWMWHCEVDKNIIATSQTHEVDVNMDDQLEDVIFNIEEYSFRKAYIYDTLCSDKDASLYKGCMNFTRLSVVLKLFNLKAKVDGWIKFHIID